MNDTFHACPHCGRDKRSLDEITESIKNFDKLSEISVDEFDYISLKSDIESALELRNVKSDPIKTAKLQNSKKILEECKAAYEQYDSTGEEDDEREFCVEALVEIQQRLNVELPELINELSC